MEGPESVETVEGVVTTNNKPATVLGAAERAGTAVPAQAGSGAGGTCPTCSAAAGRSYVSPNYVYAIGTISCRFPTLAIEKEFAQVTSRSDTKSLTDPQLLQSVLSKRENLYLARKMCWILSIEGMEAYILQARDGELDQLIGALRPEPSPMDVDVVIGMRGPIAPPELCNGLMIPIVLVDKTYSFTRQALSDEIKRKHSKIDPKLLEAATGEVFDHIVQLTDNAGATDDNRALNYLAVRYEQIYVKTAERHQDNYSLESVHVRPSALGGPQRIMDVIFSYVSRTTSVVDKFVTSVNVSEEFPFLVRPLSAYLER